MCALEACPVEPWGDVVWRCHSRKYSGDDAGGSLRSTGRYHRGSDRFPPSETWPALYTGLAIHVALGERLRHTSADSLAQLGTQRISRLRVDLQAVFLLYAADDCGVLAAVGLNRDQLCHPVDYALCHEIARIAREKAEALVVPSCTRFAEGNLIVFPDRLRAESSIRVEDELDPELYVDWARFAAT